VILDLRKLWGQRLVWLLFGLLIILLSARSGAEDVAVPPMQARVTDQVGVLDESARQALEAKLAAFKQSKGSQIAILIVPTTTPETIEQYSIRVVDAWKLGRKDIDDGVLLLLAINDRSLRIEVGRGLEGVIPDAIAKRVIAEIITPHLQQGHIPAGIDAGVSALIKLVDGEPLPEPAAMNSQSESFEIEQGIVVIAVLLGMFFRSLMGRLVGATLASGVAFIAGWLVLGGVFAALIVALIAFLFSFANGSSGGRSTRGGYSGGGFGGGGGGGFGGGGGGFGGGGASGRW